MNKASLRNIMLVLVFVTALALRIGLGSDLAEATSLAAMHHDDYPSPNAIALVEPGQSVTGELVEYVTIDGQAVQGYYAHPQDMSQPLPGILAIHEWWGLNENIQSMARRLAGEGYQVLALDLYGGEVASTPEAASLLVQEVAKNPYGAEANVAKAYDFLVTQQQAPKVASIGWCFGGSWSLETALLFPQELDAAVIYYGGQVGDATTEELSTLEMPILGIFGAEDASIPVETVETLATTLKELDKEAEIILFEDAGHAFANPSGQNYVPEAAEEAWAETTQFLAEHLQ